MSRELDEIQKRMNASSDILECDINFEEYSQIYSHTNENLRDYIKDLDGKRVLCVSASGDHLLNSIVAGAYTVDTFDINRYSPLYQELRLYAIKYLDPYDAHDFLQTFRTDLYLKFHKYIPIELREFFDYLFKEVPYKRMTYRFFSDYNISFGRNNYDSVEMVKLLQDRIDYVDRQHFSCNLYSLPTFLQEPYDVIYLSNILDYEGDYKKLFYIVRYLRDYFLNPGGELYYNYLWTQLRDISVESCFYRSDRTCESKLAIQDNIDLVEATDLVKVETVSKNYHKNSDHDTDIVMRIKKER